MGRRSKRPKSSRIVEVYKSTEDMASVCKHPRVRIVSRHDDIEFVECLECGEIFDSEEFRDMEIEEETVEAEQGDSDS
jgi:Zn ribbon nucleic-acid-binding protein